MSENEQSEIDVVAEMDALPLTAFTANSVRVPVPMLIGWRTKIERLQARDVVAGKLIDDLVTVLKDEVEDYDPTPTHIHRLFARVDQYRNPQSGDSNE